MITLERWGFPYLFTSCDKVCDHATRHLDPTHVHCNLVPLSSIDTDGNPRLETSACSVSAQRQAAAASARGSPLLGVALTLWSDWQQALAFVQPRTVIAWQKKRFRDYWRRVSESGKPGRPAISREVRELIEDMWHSNPSWGSPHIVGELHKIGFDVAKSTVEKYRPRDCKPPSPTWKAFLSNHVPDIVACDFFIVPTVNFRVLFVFIMLAHDRRRIVHFHVTEHPTTQWTAQQIVEAFPWDETPRYLLRDRDRIYGESFQQRVKNMGIEEVKIAPRSPWQNPYVERVIGSIRRECLM